LTIRFQGFTGFLNPDRRIIHHDRQKLPTEMGISHVNSGKSAGFNSITTPSNRNAGFQLLVFAFRNECIDYGADN
jgi:hypothetical protein